MLFRETVDQSTLELLSQLQQKEYLKGFHLVGGTALALRMGYRKSIEDIVAMKLNAITVSGQRVKDFIDMYYLLDKYSVAEMITFYKKKYSQYNEVNVLKSITWFDDVDLSGWPVLIKDPKLKWTSVQNKITEATNTYFKQL